MLELAGIDLELEYAEANVEATQLLAEEEQERQEIAEKEKTPEDDFAVDMERFISTALIIGVSIISLSI